jgi:hypothetical protein
MTGLTDELQTRHIDKKKWYEFLDNMLSIAGMPEVVSAEPIEPDPDEEEGEGGPPPGIAEPDFNLPPETPAEEPAPEEPVEPEEPETPAPGV